MNAPDKRYDHAYVIARYGKKILNPYFAEI